MERNNILAFVLIGIVIIGYSIWMGTNSENVEVTSDSTGVEVLNESTPEILESIKVEPQKLDSTAISSRYGIWFSKFVDGKEKTITIENDLLTAKFSTRGATIDGWLLKDYKQWNGEPVEMLWKDDKQVFMNFFTMDGKSIDTRDLIFDIEGLKANYYKLTGKDSLTIDAYLKINENKYIQKTLTFYGDKYHINTDVTLVGMEDVLPKRGYNFLWEGGVKYQEYNSVDESNEALGMAVFNGEKEELDADDTDEKFEVSPTGKVDFVGVKNKYFAAAIIPQNFDGTVDLIGYRYGVANEGFVEKYTMSIRQPYVGGKQTNSYQVYIGPLDYDVVVGYGIEKLVNFGWQLFRLIGENILMPFFNLVHMFIPNWGVTIIVFSIILKFVLYPLSRKQLKSAQKMKLLTPEITAIREKYADDMSKQQQETMALYSSYGVNPVGGCLPLLLQMPILYALWQLFRSNIDLRQAEFLSFWITDLSVPDTIVNFGFSLMGIKSISGLALAMGVTMFVQQKMTITDPRQKSMVYMMPVMFTLMFSYFPSGLNLYYFTFNLLGIGQQVYINYFSKNRPTLEDMKKSPKKEGWLQRKMREAQELAEARGQTPPSFPGQQARNQQKHAHTPKKRNGGKRKKKK